MKPIAFGLIAYLLISPLPASADDLDQVRSRGALVWGGDQEGGGPYIYPAPDDPRKVVGFEVDLMDLLAAKLGVRSQFRQCEWTNLPDLLRIGGIDAIVNGYELTEAHLQTKIATIPYYIYELQLIARRDNGQVASWEDLSRSQGRRKRVGILNGSAADTYVRRRFGDAVEVRGYQGFTDAMRDLENRNLDASVQDLPPAIFYRNRYPDLHFVDAPAGRGYYVIYLRKEDAGLRDALNAGIRDLIRGGQLRGIYERYGIWSGTQEELQKAGDDSSAPHDASGEGDAVQRPSELHGWEAIRQNFWTLLAAAGMTVLLTALSMPLAIVVGLLVALGRLYGPGIVRGLLTAYVEVLRGTPLLLQLYTIYFVLPPALGFTLDPIVAAVLGLGINYSAYEAEIYRAGLLAIPPGQMEAALALGMSRRTALRRVIVPQAVRLVIPPVTNDLIALFKDTSICSVITVVELSKRYSVLVNSTNAYLELAVLTALLYLSMSYPLSILARRLERRPLKVT